MPILGCGAELAQVLKVSDEDIASIEERLDDLMASGVDRVQAQRMAVADVLAEVELERDEVLAAIREQHPTASPAMHGKNQPVATNKDVVGKSQGGRSAGDETEGASAGLQAVRASVDRIAALAKEHGTVYVRWASNATHDLSPDARSKDHQSGKYHEGLSAIAIDSSMTPAEIAARVSEYGVSQVAEPKSLPRIYLAKRVGQDSDGYDSIRPRELLFELNKTSVEALRRGAKHILALEAIVADAEERLSNITDRFAKEITQRSLEDARAKLEAAKRDFSNEPIASDSPDAPNIAGDVAPKREPTIGAADLQNAVDQLAAAGLKKLQVAETVEGLPEAGKKRIQSEGLDGVRGMYDSATDTVWLVRDAIKDQDEALFVGLHEAFHRGLRKTLGPEVDPVLDQIYLTNPSVRRGAEERIATMGMSLREATEETLADMAGDGMARELKGWDRLVAFIRNFIGKLGMTVKFTDRMVMDLVAGARKAGMSDGLHIDSAPEASDSNAEIRLSRRAPSEKPGEAEEGDDKTPVRPSWRDELGNLQLPGGQRAYDAIASLSSPVLTRLGLKAASPELRRQMRQMKITVQKAQETAAAVAGESMKLSEEERGMVSDLIEKELDAGTIPPEHAVRLANLITNTMTAQTDELVRLGMLTKETADRWRGKYLPRFYKSKLQEQVSDAWADALKRITGRQSTMKGIKGKHLKGRGLFETVPVDQVKDWEALGWEVRDPEYEAFVADLKAFKTDWTAENRDVQVWRDFTREEREKMGEIRDAGFRFVMGYMQTQRDIALGKMFEGMAKDPAISSRLAKDDWVQVPDGKVPSTGAMRYGKMAGRWVSPETLSHLTAIEESQSEAWQMYRKAMGIWKEGKTVLNPVSHANNIISNLTMAHLAGVSYHRADKYLSAMRDFATKAPGILEAKEAGLFLGTLSDSELFNALPPELAALATKQASAAEKVGGSAFNLLSFYLRKPMGWAYQAEDTFFRYLIFKEARGRGMEPQDAVDYAQRYIFTYDDLPKGARRIRDFALPFFSYTYKAVPALLHSTLTHPHRMAAPAAVLWGVNAAAYAIAAGDDDDSWWETLQRYLKDPEFRKEAREKEELEREHLPPWMKGTTALATPKALRLGMDEMTKLPLFIDISRMIPGGDLFDVSPNAGGLPIPQPITPSHPLLTTAVAMLFNKDAFYGKELVDSNDTRGEATEKRLSWLWHQVAPAIALGNYHWERGLNALAQASDGDITWLPDVISERYTGVGRDGLPVQAGKAALQTIGIKVRPLDLDKSEAITSNQRNKIVRDIDTELNRLRRLNQIDAISDRAFDRAADLANKKKDRVKDGLTVDGEKPN